MNIVISRIFILYELIFADYSENNYFAELIFKDMLNKNNFADFIFPDFVRKEGKSKLYGLIHVYPLSSALFPRKSRGGQTMPLC